MKPNGNISRKQEKAILALLAENSVDAAARSANVGYRTLHRWLKKDDAFREHYRAARQEIVRQAVVQIQHAMTKGVQTLQDIMEDMEAPASARVAAARAIIDNGLKATAAEDFERRIKALEEFFKPKKGA